MLRERGGEYGATTGRPRRCGWLDAAALKWACQVAGFTELALTKIDVLDGTEHIPICTAYRSADGPMESFPTTPMMARAELVCGELPGWRGGTSLARAMGDLPPEAQAHVDEVERLAGVPVSMVSVGPERDSIIMRSSK